MSDSQDRLTIKFGNKIEASAHGRYTITLMVIVLSLVGVVGFAMHWL